MMSDRGWKKLPAWTGPAHRGCLHAPPVLSLARMDMKVAVGFGSAGVTRDGKPVWMEAPNAPWSRIPRLSRFEKLAAADPDHDWRVRIEGSLSMQEWQRQGTRKWVLVKAGPGFA